MLSEEQFWQFAVDLYGRDGVTVTCLTLQEQLGLNVNLLLLLCWCEQQQLQLQGSQIELLSASLQRWHQQYTQPLRQIRRQLALEDQADQQVKQTIFAAELALEKTEQRLLLGVFNQFELERSQQPQNLPRYLAMADHKAPLQYADAIAGLRLRK